MGRPHRGPRPIARSHPPTRANRRFEVPLQRPQWGYSRPRGLAPLHILACHSCPRLGCSAGRSGMSSDTKMAFAPSSPKCVSRRVMPRHRRITRVWQSDGCWRRGQSPPIDLWRSVRKALRRGGWTAGPGRCGWVRYCRTSAECWGPRGSSVESVHRHGFPAPVDRGSRCRQATIEIRP